MHRRISAIALGVFALLLMADGSAMGSEEPKSMSEARAMGDPAASAPTHASPDVRIYKGEEISEDTWTELGLACMETRTKYVCKDSVSEFAGAPAATASRKKNGASASAVCATNALWLYRHKQYEGDAVGLNYFVEWWDIGANMNNQTSSYRTGNGYAHLSDFSNGGGFWYPGDTSFCAYHSNIAQVFPEWNDRISSRYRYYG
jgi:hypothetical protein